jgi:dienelactone hydrolase
MLGNMVLLVLIFMEVGFVVWSLLKKSNLKKERTIARITLFILFLVLVFSPIIDWGFIWFMLGIILGIQALSGILFLVRKKENQPAKVGKTMVGFFGRVFLIIMAVFPVLLFPPYDPISVTGEYTVATKSFTWMDETRKELFTEDPDDTRNISIQFWYPKNPGKGEKFPIVIFSHGAFGYRMSNYSTFQELASNGYVVASIDHTYHAFMTNQENGKTIITNIEFMNNAIGASNGDITGKELYDMEQEWLKLRTEDMEFALRNLRVKDNSETENKLFSMMDLERIGVFGHSLGGATAAQVGREDEDVDAVVVIDGTMMGEIIGLENGKEMLTNEPYPKPILNFYNGSHYYDEAKDNLAYPNTFATKNALDSYQVVIEGAGHMNFTDLPIISPFLGSLLGTGTIDTSECLQITNETILQFFDRYLKSSNVQIPRERVF